VIRTRESAPQNRSKNAINYINYTCKKGKHQGVLHPCLSTPVPPKVPFRTPLYPEGYHLRGNNANCPEIAKVRFGCFIGLRDLVAYSSDATRSSNWSTPSSREVRKRAFSARNFKIWSASAGGRDAASAAKKMASLRNAAPGRGRLPSGNEV
jgi:hypothetical protein